MDWIQSLVIVGANLGTTITLFLWSRSESNQDRRQFYDLLKGIQEEMKDFHGRLVAIEERSKK